MHSILLECSIELMEAKTEIEDLEPKIDLVNLRMHFDIQQNQIKAIERLNMRGFNVYV